MLRPGEIVMPLSLPAEAMIDAFLPQAGATEECVRNLRQAFAASPALIAQVNDVVHRGALRQILPSRIPGGAEYDHAQRTIKLSPDLLSTSSNGIFNSAPAILTLGHELQHAADVYELMQVENRLDRELESIALSNDREHNYTAPIGNYLSLKRRLEAKAEISGWNALVSAAQKEAQDRQLPLPSLEDIHRKYPYRMGRYIEVDRSRSPATYTIRPELEIDDYLQMAISERNLEGMGRRYFDTSSGLGHYGNSSYANFYGAHATSNAAITERTINPRHDVRIDLASLKLSARTLAQNGIDLGADMTPIQYVDKSAESPVRDLLRDTMTSHTYYPDMPSIDTFHHPGHQLYLQAMTAISRIEEAEGFPLRGSKNLAAVLAVQARRAGMDAIDHVSIHGNQVYAVQGNPYAVTKRLTEAVDKDAGTNTHIEKSGMDWQLAARHRPAARQDQRQTPDQAVPMPQRAEAAHLRQRR